MGEDLKVFIERWSLHRGGLCNKHGSVICHLWDIIILCGLYTEVVLYKGDLCTEVVFLEGGH